MDSTWTFVVFGRCGMVPRNARHLPTRMIALQSTGPSLVSSVCAFATARRTPSFVSPGRHFLFLWFFRDHSVRCHFTKVATQHTSRTARHSLRRSVCLRVQSALLWGTARVDGLSRGHRRRPPGDCICSLYGRQFDTPGRHESYLVPATVSRNVSRTQAPSDSALCLVNTRTSVFTMSYGAMQMYLYYYYL